MLYQGNSYIASLKDGRKVFDHTGAPVEDLGAHLSTARTVGTVASLYETLSSGNNDELCTFSDVRPELRTLRFFRCSRSVEDLRRQKVAISRWAKETKGWFTRPPDYKGSLTQTLFANQDYFGEHQENCRRWYEEIQTTGSFLGHALTGPRGKGLRVLSSSAEGLIVSGERHFATNAAVAHMAYLSDRDARGPKGETEIVLAFMLRLNRPGVSVHLAPSNTTEESSDFIRSLEENDAVISLDQVLVPWEDIFVYRHARLCPNWDGLGFHRFHVFHTTIRQEAKLEFLLSAFHRVAEESGRLNERDVRDAVAVIHSKRALLGSLAEAMVITGEANAHGFFFPGNDAVEAAILAGPASVTRALSLIKTALPKELLKPASQAAQILGDVVVAPFGVRHELYETNYSGSLNSRLHRLTNSALKTIDHDHTDSSKIIRKIPT